MRKLLVVGFAGFLGVLISSTAGAIWTMLLVGNLATSPSFPWAVPAMAVVLWVGWRYLAGDGPPRSTSHARRSLLRARPIGVSVFVRALVCGSFGVVALAGLWIIFTELFPMPANVLPDYSSYPLVTVALAIAMGSLVSPLSEEAGFRGYCQVILERNLPQPAAAVLVSSLFFTIPHIPVAGLFIPKLAVYFLVGVTFGAIAYFANSILASIPVHILGDLTFFTFVWPFDAARPPVSTTGFDTELVARVAQVVIFGALCLFAFGWLRRAKPPSLAPSRQAPV